MAAPCREEAGTPGGGLSLYEKLPGPGFVSC